MLCRNHDAMAVAPDIKRRISTAYKVVHCLLPSWQDGEVASASDVGSVAFAFTAQREAFVSIDGSPVRRRTVPANSVGLGGGYPIRWLRTDAPSDLVEISASPELRTQMAEEAGVPGHADLADIHGASDDLIGTIALSLRAGLRDWRPISELETEYLVRAAYARVLERHFAARIRSAGTLDKRRRDRALAFVAGNADVTLTQLADAVALSPYHFARSFRATFGMPPHRFVTVRRLEKAFLALIRDGATVARAAEIAGYSNLHHFRRMFRGQYGRLPSEPG